MPMDVSFSNVPTKKPSLIERFAAAFYAFNMTVAPDMAAVLTEIQKIAEKNEEAIADRQVIIDEAMDKLDPFNKATIESICGATLNWHLLFGPAMATIEELEVADQLTIVRHMFHSNRHIVRQQAFRNWMSRHADAILDALEDEGH